MSLLLDEPGLVAEPSGAVTTAAFLSQRHTLPPGTTEAVLSGGNVEDSTFHALTGRYLSDRIPA